LGLLVVGSARFGLLGILGGKALGTRANLGSRRGFRLVLGVVVPPDFFIIFSVGA
jgi:hypothetical protein